MSDQAAQLASQNLVDAAQQPTISQQTQQGVAQAAQAATPPAAQAPANSADGDNLVCQWTGCGQRWPNPVRLYDHVCDLHVGRKNTNNLNLTCSWGNCHTTVVKRDHITSHMRVHVPLKPHRCTQCGKTFKRPQDLKKHIKTHAEDSAMRSEGGNGGNGNRNGGQNFSAIAGQARQAAGYYPDASMQGNGGIPYGFQPPNNGAQGYYGQQTPQGSVGYGPVYYNVSAPQTTHTAAGFSQIDNFFRAAKGRDFDPSNYQGFSQHLVPLQGIQLPNPAESIGMMHGMNTDSMMDGHGGIYAASAHHPPQPFAFENLRSKQDLTSLDMLLQEMRSAAYEHRPSNGVGMPPPGDISAGASETGRSSNSPPSNASHVSLAPGSQVSFNTRSPVQAAAQHTAMTTGGLYPTLPVGSAPTANMSGNVALGSAYDQHQQRRSGGRLQRAQPKEGFAALTEDKESVAQTEEVSKKRKGEFDINIDPALAGLAVEQQSGSASTTPTGSAGDDTWALNLDFLERLNGYVQQRLQCGDYIDEEAEQALDIKAGLNVNAEIKQDGEGEPNQEMPAQTQHEEQSLYPILKT